jgi:flagellar hook-associated protein 2
MGISINGPSGIDTKTIIDTLVGIEEQKVTKVEASKATDQLKIDAYSKVKSFLSDIKTKSAALSKSSSFDLFKSTSSDEKSVTITGGTGSVDGQYDVKVFQLATNEKMISTDGQLTSQTASLSSQGITTGTIRVDGVDIAIDDDDSIQDLRMKINTATNTKGEKLGVSASVVKISDTNFRLVLGAKNTGSAGIAYSDISGSTLQNLGIITNATGDKGNIKQSIRSTTNTDTAFSNLATGGSIQYSGTDHNGNVVSNTFIKADTSTIDDFLTQIENSYFGTVDASIDAATGNLIIDDKSSGTSRLSMGTLTIDSAPQTVAIATVGKEGAGVLSTGKDSFLSVENIYMNNTSNSVTGTFTGVTFQLLNTTVEKSATVTLARDSDAVQKKFQELIDSYNALAKYAKSATSHKDPKNKESTDGELAGDSTLLSIVSQVRAQMKQEFGLFGSSGKYTNLTMFGMKTDITTGELSVDGTMFKKGFDTHFDDMLKIFTTIGVSENTSLTLGRNTSDTTAGKYQLEVVDSEHLRIQLENSTDWYTSDARVGDIVNFTDGPAKGMTLTAPSSSIGATGNTFTFSKGLSAFLDETISKLNDAHDGVITLRQDSWRKSMDTKSARITKLTDQNERYRNRLTQQYSAMEQAMSTLQSQTTNIISQFSN